jgi:uncharacterized protein (DUF302 family)
MNPIRSLAALAAAAALAGCAATADTGNGMLTLKSPYSAAETLSRLEAQIKQRNLAVVARVDHAAAAQRINQTLRPNEVFIFGNPQAGTPLMLCAQAAGIDLPMKALVWVDTQQQVWLGYNDPVWIVRRHGGGDCPAAQNVRKALAAIADATVAQ